MSYYEETKRKSTSREDRYKDCLLLKDKETGENLQSTRDLKEVKITNQDKYHVVATNEVGRLDIIANNYYKNPLLWWVIAETNNIFDPITQVTRGKTLRIPTADTLYGNKGILL